MPELCRISELMNPRQVEAPGGGGPDPDPAACEVGALAFNYACQTITMIAVGMA
jgi:hypothetical protein